MGLQLSLLDMEPLTAVAVQAPAPRPAKPRLRTVSVDSLDADIERYAQQAHAERTRVAYQGDWRRFQSWCDQSGEVALPASAKTLSRYLAALANLGRRPSTIHRARVAISKAHALAGLPRPDADERARLVEKGIRRTLGVREQGASALLPDQLRAMARALGRGARAERDRALLLLGYAGAFRRGELIAIRLEHLRFHADGVTVFVPRAKGDPEGKGAQVYIPRSDEPAACPVEALRIWADRLADTHGPVFVRISDGLPTEVALSDQTVTRVVRGAARRAGLEGAYSAHSLRAGFATAAHLAGQSERDIQAHGRWESRVSLDRYVHRTRNVKVL